MEKLSYIWLCLEKNNLAFKNLSRCLMPSPNASATRVTNVLYLSPKNWTNQFYLQ